MGRHNQSRLYCCCCATRPITYFLWLAAYTLAAMLFFPALQNLLLHSGETYKLDKNGAHLDPNKWTQEAFPVHPSSRRATAELNGGTKPSKLWKPPPNRGLLPCVKPSKKYRAGKGRSRGFLVVHTNGGLNQMRAGICDMVAVARILNATLVIPELDKSSFWNDSSKFADIFNEEHFVQALKDDIDIVKKLPPDVAALPKASKQFRSWSNVKYYEDEIAPLFDEYQVIRAKKSDSRLANNGLPADIQKLRCRVHYDALRFAPRIEEFGWKLVERMRSEGPYIALHLRYEHDVLAFSGCTHGLTEEEAEELAMTRATTPHWKVKIINSTEQRAKGLCPLTPKEMGIFLQGLGYPSTTRIYIAAGKIHGGEQRMEDLKLRFPHIMRKETIATAKELAPFRSHASQLAALDYIVSIEADVFVPTFAGNMARAVEGHRRYLGHRRSILPDRKALVDLFDRMERGELAEGPELSRLITELHKRRQGAPRKRKGPTVGSKGKDRFRTEEAFYTNPLPDCLCHPDVSSMVPASFVRKQEQ